MSETPAATSNVAMKAAMARITSSPTVAGYSSMGLVQGNHVLQSAPAAPTSHATNSDAMGSTAATRPSGHALPGNMPAVIATTAALRICQNAVTLLAAVLPTLLTNSASVARRALRIAPASTIVLTSLGHVLPMTASVSITPLEGTRSAWEALKEVVHASPAVHLR